MNTPRSSAHESAGLRPVLLWAKVDWLRVGIMFGLPEEMTYPSIELFYPKACRPVIVRLARRMKERGFLPEVYLSEQKKYFDVVVFFRFTEASFEEVDQILDHHWPPGVEARTLQRQTFEVIATGEAEISKKSIRIFKELFRHRNFFHLLILEQGGKRPLTAWEIQLTEVKRGLPNFINRD